MKVRFDCGEQSEEEEQAKMAENRRKYKGKP